MNYRWSASFIKKYKNCKFFGYCKIFKEETGEVDFSYGLAGNIVHDSLEYYYKNLLELPKHLALVELKNRFNILWEDAQIINPKIEKSKYWLSIINGVNLSLNPTHLEFKFELSKPIDFVGYADVVDINTHTIGDWKTATYKSSKLTMYYEQLQYYAWAYYRTFKTIPSTWVYFNKVNRMFKYAHTEQEIHSIEKELIILDNDLKKRLITKDFPRSPSQNNCFFCQYKEICSSNLLRVQKAETYDIIFHLKKNKLMIEGAIEDVTHRKIEKFCNFLVKNAQFRIAAMKARGVHYDGIKRLYRRREYGAETFIGFIHHIRQVFKEYAEGKGKVLNLTIKDFRDQDIMSSNLNMMPEKLNVPYEFYPFQNIAVDTLIKFRWGIVEIGTGGGKTAIAAECIRRLDTKTIFIIDNKDLLLQTKKEYEEMLGIECGIVGLGYRDWDKQIILSTIQTLAKDLKGYAKHLKTFNLVIYDETHIIAADSFAKLSRYLENTKYRFGFSATARRDDGNDFIIYAHAGEVVYRKPAKELIEQDVLVKPQAIFYEYESDECVTDSFSDAYHSTIVDNETRNKLICEIANDYVAEGKQVMILTKLIEHGKAITEMLPNSRFIYGKTADDIRVSDLEDFRDGKFPILVGNIMIFNKGINIKNLDVVINATGNAGNVLTIQTIGRALRKNKDKDVAYYIDFLDKGEYFKKHSKSRVKALKDEGYEVFKA